MNESDIKDKDLLNNCVSLPPTGKNKPKENESQFCEICQAPISSIELECPHGLSETLLGVDSS